MNQVKYFGMFSAAYAIGFAAALFDAPKVGLTAMGVALIVDGRWVSLLLHYRASGWRRPYSAALILFILMASIIGALSGLVRAGVVGQ